MASDKRRELATRASLAAARDEQAREVLRRRLPRGGGSPTPPAQQEASDVTGSVTITVNYRGRVEDVQIDCTDTFTQENVYESRDGAHVCATAHVGIQGSREPPLTINILDENPRARILVHPGRNPAWDEPRSWDEGWYPWEQPYPWNPGAVAERIADEVLANLDSYAS